MVIGYVVGRILEARHYRSIRAREHELRDIMVFASRFPPTLEPLRQDLVAGSVVVSADYFKVVVAGLQSIVGGRTEDLRNAARPCAPRGHPAHEGGGARDAARR